MFAIVLLEGGWASNTQARMLVGWLSRIFKNRYFMSGSSIKPSLPSPTGLLSASLKIDVIKVANEAVCHSSGMGKISVRDTYEKISPDKQAMAAKYACQHGNNTAWHFPKELNVTFKESSVSIWKVKYKAQSQRGL